MSANTPPRFVNPQRISVKVYDENRRPLLVLPFEDAKGSTTRPFVVEGEFYRQFCQPTGGLCPFPDQNEPLRALPLSDEDRCAAAIAASVYQTSDAGVDSTVARPVFGKLRLAGDVVRSGTVIGETQEAFIERLRPKLIHAGITTKDELTSASDEALFDVRLVTPENIKRVRDLANLLFPDSPSGFAPIAEPPAGIAIQAEVPQPTDEDGNALNTYKMRELLFLNLKDLRELIDAEGFVISKKGNKIEVRDRLLNALRQYNMLIE